MDKESAQIKHRKRILAILENGQIMEIKRQDKLRWRKAFLGMATFKDVGKEEVKEDQIVLENKENFYQFDNLDKSSNVPQKIQGKILSIYRNCNSTILPPFFLVHNVATNERSLYSINFVNSRLEEYKIEDLNEDSPLIFLNPIEESDE